MRLRILDKIGSIGAIVAAAACPVCFPLLAAVGSVIGLGFFHRYEGKLLIFFQALVLLALAGLIVSFWRHRNPVPLIIGVPSTLLVFYAFYIRFSEIMNYLGLAGLVIASVMNTIANRRRKR
ncbi:MerC family mercury resistance protein [Geobacter sp.]|uniref:MerC family mercury resistance protein n=1 Tax=Geobacter sp. TaxID=46610 RepID=UPI002622F706|nr:MerC family mercury resistance protein [Geobacter sp.]